MVPVKLTELLRSWAAMLPFTDEEPRATAGMAGGIWVLPFMGDGEDDEAACCCAGAEEEPTTAGLDPVAITGVAAGFLGAPAAEAYDAVAIAGVGIDAGML